MSDLVHVHAYQNHANIAQVLARKYSDQYPSVPVASLLLEIKTYSGAKDKYVWLHVRKIRPQTARRLVLGKACVLLHIDECN